MGTWLQRLRVWGTPTGVAAAILLAAYGLCVLLASNLNAPAWLTKDTAPPWVQAVFSVLAIVVAIVLPARDRSHRERGELLAAQLVAAQVATHLEQAAKNLQRLLETWDETAREGGAEGESRYLQDLRSLRGTLDKPTFRFKRETLTALIPLPGRTAHRIAQGCEYLKICERRLQGHSSGIENGGLSHSMLRNLHASTGQTLHNAYADLRYASQQCSFAAKVGVAVED